MSILIFLVVLLVLVIVHEFGHFIVAKKSGIRVDEFGVGFPPKIVGKKFGETEYTLNALPFGGFVRIFGENPDEESLRGHDKDRAMMHKSKWTQAGVLFAGVFFNILLAWVLFSVTLMAGTPAVAGTDNEHLADIRVTITQVVAGSPADRVSLKQGDEIVSLSAGERSIILKEASEVGAFISAHGEEEIRMNIIRSGEEQSVMVLPETGLIVEDATQSAIGIGVGAVGTLSLPLHLALYEGAKKTGLFFYYITIGIGTFLFQAVTLNADFSTVAGPVGIVGLVGDASALGLIALLNFTAFISLNLAVINLIPFPALDGGRLLFLLVESIKGSPIRPQVANMVNMVGFALLIFLMLVVTYNDILRIVG